MKKILIITVMIFSTQAFASEVPVRGKSLTFNSALYSGSISNKVGDYRPYILLSEEHDLVGELTCKNSTTAFGKNWADLIIRTKDDVSHSLIYSKYMKLEECIKIAKGLVIGERNVTIKFDGNIHRYSPAPYLGFELK